LSHRADLDLVPALILEVETAIAIGYAHIAFVGFALTVAVLSPDKGFELMDPRKECVEGHVEGEN
jgi:hypothetical protein